MTWVSPLHRDGKGKPELYLLTFGRNMLVPRESKLSWCFMCFMHVRLAELKNPSTVSPVCPSLRWMFYRHLPITSFRKFILSELWFAPLDSWDVPSNKPIQPIAMENQSFSWLFCLPGVKNGGLFPIQISVPIFVSFFRERLAWLPKLPLKCLQNQAPGFG